jgi:hypothetical protein
VLAWEQLVAEKAAGRGEAAKEEKLLKKSLCNILKYEAEKEQAKYLAEKDEPVRLGKGNENIKIAVNHLKSELEGLIREA